MSASSKKKLRKAQEAEKLTEKQLTEQKEAKKLKIYSTIFVVVLAVMVVAALWIGITTTITNSGIRERSTAALTVGEHELSNAELNYFYVDAVQTFYSQYGSYAAMFGLDVTAPLNEQVINEETGETWADDFLASAKENAKAVYALTDEAAKQGYTLTEEDLATIDNSIATMQFYALYNYGYPDMETYLKAVYGKGATEESFRAYAELTTLAQSFQNHYASSLTYDDAALREAEAENYDNYSSFSYNSYYLPVSSYLEGGTTDEEGNTTYSDEERAAAVEAAEADAKALAEGEYESIADLDAAIAALSINAEAENAASTAYENTAYASVNSVIRDWVLNGSRAEGNMTYIPSTTTSTAEDGTETTTTNGYYVVWYIGSNNNEFPLTNVRHILVSFEGGTTDETTGITTYSLEEKDTAKKAAEEILADWKAGEATEDSFAALANEKSTDPGSNTTGGLYEDIYPGQMVVNFNDWCFDESRKPGDTGIVESDYGYHVMYFVGDSDTTYRDYMITNDLVEADTTEWYNALVEAMTVTEVNTKYISKDMVLSAG